ncbi:MAG TPA: CDP-alcohol phosphatidyltransferase family protein [Sedimentisphaerales bacterium]|nr:CDP-alcohol phosphatidyltransferase family protein [Sedimentisphaerales bacterium]
MTRLKTQAAKESLLRRVRRQRLKYITVLPSLVTILNGVCGFAAIAFASKGAAAGINHFSYHRLTLPYFAMAGYMVLLAMIADVLDGRLARMSKNTSSFGGQLDSLCDIISFGVAPAFLMLKVLEYKLSGYPEQNLSFANFLQRFIWLAAAAYISCAAIRLARFNVENEEDESAHMSFIGLPTTAAAGVVVSVVIFHQETLLELSARSSRAYVICENAVIYALPLLVLGVAVLMVSRIRYPHILNQYIKGKKPFAHLIRALLFLGLIIWSRQVALVLIFCGFAASGFLKWFYYKVIHRKSDFALSAELPAMMTADRGPIAEQDDSD